ncbi:MAG: GTP pyrophosphokinase family protein [Lachnospiraceae bacterium]
MSQVEKQLEDFWNAERVMKYESGMGSVIEMINGIDRKEYAKTGSHMIRFVEKRLKSPESIVSKLKRKGLEKEIGRVESVLNDLAGVRAICFDARQVYELANEVRKNGQFKIIKEKDYIAKPKINGYQSYHMILECFGVKVELQIRTILMDAWSSLETILVYKKTVPIPKDIESDILKFSKWSRKMDLLVEKMLERRA